MSGTLFLAHRLPFPPDRGDKIRSHHILRELARLGPAHVGCFAETEDDCSNEAFLGELAESHCMPMRSKPVPLAGVEALLRGEAVSLAAFRNGALAHWVEQTVAQEGIETIYIFSGQMGQYVPRGWRGRLVVDLVDVDSAKFEAYAEAKAWPMRWVDAREGRLLRAEEARLAGLADQTLLVSEAEVALLRSRLPANARGNVRALGNGIDAELFDPASVTPHPELAAEAGPHLVFTGQMDYAPNVAAVQFAVREVLPAIREIWPEAGFHIVGRAPSAEVRALDGEGGCRVWGAVPDVRPFLAAADLVLAPLTIARGVQNKVLEAMAMARPVLLTPEAATGIDAEDGTHFAVADGAQALVSRALELLGDPRRSRAMGTAARQFVVERMSWPAMLADLPALIGHAPAKGCRDAA